MPRGSEEDGAVPREGARTAMTEICAHGYYRCACAGIASPHLHHNTDYNSPIGRHEPCDDPLPLDMNPAIDTFVRFVQELSRALDTLITKMDSVHADPRYVSVWGISQMHIGPYDGPEYDAELNAAREALVRVKRVITQFLVKEPHP